MKTKALVLAELYKLQHQVTEGFGDAWGAHGDFRGGATFSAVLG